MKKKKFVILATAVLMAVAAIYITMTPEGALRFKLLTSGYPIKAVTMRLREKAYPMSLDFNQKGYTLENPPTEKDTQAELYNWVVTKHGIFYTAKYYGWG